VYRVDLRRLPELGLHCCPLYQWAYSFALDSSRTILTEDVSYHASQ